VLLLLFLTYPLGPGHLARLHRRQDRPRRRVDRPGELPFLWATASRRLALFNTLFYTFVASVLKFASGLWLALLLNKNLPFKSFFRAVVLLPWIVPTALSAIAFWWIYDSQFSVISWALTRSWADRPLHRLPRRPWNARWSTIAANVWRGIPFVAISLLAGLQTISPSLYEAAALDGATPWQRSAMSRCRC
jgi:multiple sugar transport system permease protein